MVLAALIGRLRDFELAEDALQDAFEAALETWPGTGAPASPRAWLLTTARRKALDRLRHRSVAKKKHGAVELAARLEAEEAREADMDPPEIPDERLRLIFTCCHPALNEAARVALTLRTVAGLTTPEIARAFLVPEPTLAQRLVRAQRKIRDAGIPYRVPSQDAFEERLASVLAVVYLVFNEGYQASGGAELVRADLFVEAQRLGALLTELLPESAEAWGLRALMRLHDARRPTRVDAAGALVPLEDQDRARWDRGAIDEGLAHLDRALAQQSPGPYQVQAAVSALHARAPRFEDTDWPQIVALYESLFRMHPTPVVALNAAVAAAMAEGPEAGLSRLRFLASELDGYQPFHAARADLLRRAGHSEEAAGAYRRALELTRNEAERAFLTRRLASL